MICEMCKQEVIDLDRHHIKSEKYGGSNKKKNIADICPNCHRGVHLGLYVIEGRFFIKYGNILIWRKKGEPSITGVIPPPCYIMGSKE